jgi:hypothetical protein
VDRLELIVRIANPTNLANRFGRGAAKLWPYLKKSVTDADHRGLLRIATDCSKPGLQAHHQPAPATTKTRLRTPVVGAAHRLSAGARSDSLMCVKDSRDSR